MYKNRINRTSTNLDLHSLIRRCDIEFDQRARYVEFVCSIWNEGRFGPNLADPVTVDQHLRPEPRLAEPHDPWDAPGRNTTGGECARNITILRDARGRNTTGTKCAQPASQSPRVKPVSPASAISAYSALKIPQGRAGPAGGNASVNERTSAPRNLFTLNQGRGTP